jgi:hypothetical protein
MNEALRGTVRGHAMAAADYVIFAVLVAVPVVIVWFALSHCELIHFANLPN